MTPCDRALELLKLTGRDVRAAKVLQVYWAQAESMVRNLSVWVESELA